MWALAIGWPFNYGLTPTMGRVIEIADDDLYIDVLVEPGNSGGPLIDSTGAVIGTVTASFLDDQDVSTGYNIATKTRALCSKLLICRE
jgi:S1-C subfamily serine protease